MRARVIVWAGERLELAAASAVTIGVFDGLHLGHQRLVRQTVAAARDLGLPAACVTFFPSPEVVLGKAEPLYLTLPDERAALLGDLGVDLVLVTRFDEGLAALSATEFMMRLNRMLHPAQVWVGEGFALGRGRAGSVPVLAELGHELGYDLRVVPPLRVGDTVVSSTLIRSLVGRGDVVGAAELLGRPYCLRGRVVHGVRRGRELGFPTANVAPPPGKQLPSDGVYAAMVGHGDACLPAVLSIGVRPTFGANERSIEVHLIGFAGDIYGAAVDVSFVARLRDELRFESAEALRAQIERDVATARAVLAGSLVATGEADGV